MTFYQRGNGVNENLLIDPPSDPEAMRQTFTVASDGSFDLDEDIKKVDEWLARMPTEEEEETGPGPAGLFGVEFHHGLRKRGSDDSDTEQESEDENADATQSMMKKSKFGSGITDLLGNPVADTPKRKGKAHKRTGSQSFTFGSQSQATMGMPDRKTASNSFSGRPSQLATPPATSPATLPPFTFGASSSTNMAASQNPSMFVFGSANQHRATSRSSSPSLPQSARTINGPVPNWLANQQGADDDDDMPDTDPGESFSEDAE
jgi:hypothetical protein